MSTQIDSVIIADVVKSSELSDESRRDLDKLLRGMFTIYEEKYKISFRCCHPSLFRWATNSRLCSPRPTPRFFRPFKCNLGLPYNPLIDHTEFERLLG